jgi:hypothetical protein
VLFEEAVNYGKQEYYDYEYAVPAPQPGLYLWVKPYDFCGNEGSPSTLAQVPPEEAS